MAQLSDDCFAVGEPLMSLADAAELIRARVPVSAGIETVPLHEADGRILVDDVVSGLDLPPFHNSAVDGYAVRSGDLRPMGETRLPVAGRVAAGEAASTRHAAGPCAIRIFTGAALPEGFDTVFMQEDVRREGDHAVLPAGLAPGANRRLAGEDVARGALAIAAGRRLGPPDIALAAALGLTGLGVRERPRVALFSTGNELVDPGRPLRAGQIHDSNRALLAALLRRHGAAISDLGILPDEPAVLAERLRAAACGHHLVLTSGGVSVGEEDHVKGAVERIGRLAFWRLAVKPGRPVAMGTIAGTPFVGLPGNPVAVYVTFLFVVAPLLARLAGAGWAPPLPLPVRSAFAFKRKAGRREYLRVSLRPAPDGSVQAFKFPRDGSGLLSSLAGSDGLAELPEDVAEIREGDTISFLPHAALW